MEPDDQKLIQAIMNHYKWPTSYEDGLLQTPSLRKNNGEIDLSVVSTRDLLNECYRRRAIEKFTATSSVDTEVFDSNKNDDGFMRHIERDITHLLIDSMQQNRKFYTDAVVVNETKNHSFMRYEFGAELFICKHPTKVRK